MGLSWKGEYMIKLSCFFLFLAIYLTSLFFAACTEPYPDFPPGSGYYYYHKAHSFLINGTNGLLHYKSIVSMQGDIIETFETSLLPNDTLFIYETDISSPHHFSGRHLFSQLHLIVKDYNGNILSNSMPNSVPVRWCGEPNLVWVETDGSVESSLRLSPPIPVFSGKIYRYYWTIDSAYIADMACDMSLEDLESEVLQND